MESKQRPWHNIPPDTPEQLAEELERYPEVKAALFADTFVGRFCVACGCKPILFAEPVWFSGCPHCVAQRLRQCQSENPDLPWWVEFVAFIGEGYSKHMHSAHWGPLTVKFDDFCKCHACGKLVQVKDARYFVQTRAVHPPHCLDCYSRLNQET
jgi:hypothetical protein